MNQSDEGGNRGLPLNAHSITSIRNPRKLLRFGMYIGPFIAAGIYLLCWAAAGWIRSPSISYGLVAASLGTGVSCFVFYKRPTGIQWLLLAPYLLVYAAMTYVFAIALALFLGAPK